MSKSKWGKTILGLVAVGGAVAAGALYLSKKNKCEECDDFEAEFEDEDFDLDSDLKPVTDREYVSLSASADESADEAAADVVETVDDVVDEIAEVSEDEVSEE